MVSDTGEAELGTAGLAFWAGVERALHYYCDIVWLRGVPILQGGDPVCRGAAVSS